MFDKKLFLFFTSLVISFNGCSKLDQKFEIAFPSALDRANIQIDSLNDILNGSLIIGNGDINALLYSTNNSLVMNLTKNDVWDARVETKDDPPLPTFNLIKQLGLSDTAFPLTNNNSGYVLPEGMKWDKKDSYHSEAYPCPRQCAQILIQNIDEVNNLTGELDLKNAVATFRRPNSNPIEIRALADRNTFLIHTPNSITLKPIRSKGIPEAETGVSNKVSWLVQKIPPDLDWEGMEFAVAVASLENVNAVSIVTSLESNDVLTDAVKLATKTVNAEVNNLISDHESSWRKYWSLSGINLENKLLESTWYRSLYFLRCVSKPGVQSVGLFAGLINDIPAWHGDYHTNYNIQQTFWSAYPSNHTNLAEPYDRLIYEYLKRAKWLSNKVYSMKGAYYPHVMYAYELEDPEMCKSNNGRQYIHHTWGMTIGVNGFSIQPLWWRYKYDPDKVRLREIVYPVLKEVAIFYAEFIEQCEGESKIKLGPSVSPEHWGWTKNLERNYNCTFDIAYAKYSLQAAIEAAEILKVGDNLIERFDSAIKHLPNYPLYHMDSTLVVDIDGAPPIEYNIPVPSTPVFPGDVITWWSTESEKNLFKNTIDQLNWNGNNATFMLAIARARLSMIGSQNWLENEIKSRLRPNGTIALNRLKPHKRFNDFGHYTEQFGASMAVSEILIQSVGDIIRLFPAIDKGISASFADLRTQGGFLVSSAIENDNVTKLEVKSIYGGELKLLCPWQNIEGLVENSEDYVKFNQDAKGVITINTKPGEKWKFRAY